MEIDILIEDPAWEATGLDALASAAFRATFTALDLPAACFSVSLLACDDDRIAALNSEFRGKATPTNVLSWPADDRAPARAGDMPTLPAPDMSGPPLALGDIAITFGVVTREAADAGKPLDHHLSHLLVHGLLHLLGFDHIHDADADRMESLETAILARLGIADPY
ncbi:rRNA maturation RNase YbeY [Rhodobacterales bacterium LSUCC0031]|nr:rRNA maturation RNase YbeY [Rhodobacterales bacterium LSUCC0031]